MNDAFGRVGGAAGRDRKADMALGQFSADDARCGKATRVGARKRAVLGNALPIFDPQEGEKLGRLCRLAATLCYQRQHEIRHELLMFARSVHYHCSLVRFPAVEIWFRQLGRSRPPLYLESRHQA